jgi:radical SAM protein with 4Fe4S-binding SPASM domain
MAHVILSDRCNHACLHCYQVHGQRGEMSTAEVIHAFDELAAAGVLVLAISGGEISLRPDLVEVLRAARERNFAVTLQTNGYDWSDDLIAEVARLGIWQVRVSIYSCSAHEHDAVTRVPGSFARTIATARALRQASVPVRLIVTLTSLTTSSREDFAALAASLDCALDMASMITAREDATTASQAVLATDAQLRAYYAAESPDLYDPVLRHEDKLAQRPCGVCSSSFTLHADGGLRPCTHLPIELARVADGAVHRLAEIDAYRAFADLRWRDVHGCRDCALLPLCQRCHGSAGFETGDILGPQPSACRLAVARLSALEGAPITFLTDGSIEREAGLGPFERVGARALRPIPDLRTAADDALSKRLSGSSHPVGGRGILPLATLVRRRSVRARDVEAEEIL